MKYEYCLFDLDGTLTESGPGITRSVAYALERFGIHTEDYEALSVYVGPPLIDSFMKYHGLTHEQAVKALECYREYYRSRGMFENSVYPGVEQMLTRLAEGGAKLMVVTSKPEEFAVKILDHYGLSRCFEKIYGATMDEKRNKKADIIDYAMKAAGIDDKKSVVMVGDRDQDVEGAAVNGIDCIGVLYGYGSREELETAGAAYIVGTAEAVADIVCSG